MFDRWCKILLRWLKVPPQPDPPLGAPGSERVFRSGRNALRLSLALWAINQGFALVGLIFWLGLLAHWQGMGQVDPKETPPAAPDTEGKREVDSESAEGAPRKKKPQRTPLEFLANLSRITPAGVFRVINVVEGLSLLAFLVQIPVTYALRRLEYEQRWYIVTDRSLRLRSGVWKVQEVTMSFANLQQITVTQDPLQRVLGLADVRVKSAGGGDGGAAAHGKGDESAHLGYFRAVDNAEEIRDLITERLRRFRESGLGDPDEARRSAPAAGATALSPDVLVAARELLAEAKALRKWSAARSRDDA